MQNRDETGGLHLPVGLDEAAPEEPDRALEQVQRDHAPPYRTVLRVDRLNFSAEGRARICAIIVGVRRTRVTDRRSIARSASSGSNSGCRNDRRFRR